MTQNWREMAETADEAQKRYLSVPYIRARITIAGSHGVIKRTVWAKRITERLIQVVDKEGVWTGEFILASPADFLWVKEARLNLHYGELEVIDHGSQ